MPAHRRDPGAVSTDVSFQEQHVDEHGDVLEAVHVLGQPHAIDADHAVCLDVNLRSTFDDRSAETGRGFNVVPGRRPNLGFELFEAVRVLLDEESIDDTFALLLGRIVRGEDMLADPDDDGDVAANLHLVVLAADLRRLSCQHLRRVLGIDEDFQALFTHGIEGDDLNASLGGVLERMQEAWAVRSRVLAEKEHRITVAEVVEDHSPNAGPNQFFERHGRRFVAHVRTVRQVVVAINPREQRIKVGSLKAGPAGRIEND